MVTYHMRKMLGRFEVVVSTDNNRSQPWIIRDVFSQTSKMKLYGKTVNGIQPLTIFAKHPILDVGMGSEHVSDNTK